MDVSANVAVDVTTWAQELDQVMERIGPRFARAEARQRAEAYLQGLLSPAERKNSWQLAEMLGEPTPYSIQQFLYRSVWDADHLRDDLRRYVVEQLGDADAILILDETGFLKKGDKSAGVQRQYSGTAGKRENCQIGVFLTYASTCGTAFIDRALYLPQSWTEDRERCRCAGIPDQVGFATKPQMGLVMLEHAVAHAVPFGWAQGTASMVTTDGSVCGWRVCPKPMCWPSRAKNMSGSAGSRCVWATCLRSCQKMAGCS